MLFAYEDHVSLGSTTLSLETGSLKSGSLANLKTRQLAETVGIGTVAPGFYEIDAIFDEDRAVQMAAVLNYNFEGAGTAQTVELYDSGDSLIATSGSASLDVDINLYTISYYLIFGQTYSNVRKVRFTANVVGNQTIGRLWAGPVFAPENIKAFDFGFGVADPSGISTSRGGQAYADPYNRLRTLSARLPALTEAEAFGDATDSSVINAQDMLFTVGRHRELIIIPYTGDSSLIHKWGLYGHLTNYSDIVPVRPGDATIGRLFELSLNAIEER